MMPIPIPTPLRCRVAGLFVSTLLVCGVAAAQAPAQAPTQGPSTDPAGPRLEVPELEVDLGQLVRGETAEARFALHNRGVETLRILRAKPG